MRPSRVWSCLIALVSQTQALATALATPLVARESTANNGTLGVARADPRLLDEVVDALDTIQREYYDSSVGTWPTAIDWTAAIIGTHVTGALTSLSYAARDDNQAHERENLIALYFSQVIAFYYGQDHVGIRGQAFDDMLWVVLGWLDAVRFVDLHTQLYFPEGVAIGSPPHLPLPGDQSVFNPRSPVRSYFGNAWTSAFAHRSRVFWDLADRGWDDKYCGGGMNWNPRLLLYKNAITNELWVAASINMYLYFPGDRNNSPFIVKYPKGPHLKMHLDMAVRGHQWLRDVGMRNGPNQMPEGLYIDGYHVSGMSDPKSNNRKCDQRNNAVFTYNQGVLLSGLRGLWKAKGDESLVNEGHALIKSAIKASGWDLQKDKPLDRIQDLEPGQLPPWRGLGRAGVMEDMCDVAGECSADSQSFKGIFFHHLVAFCVPLEAGSDTFVAHHADECRTYKAWVLHNAKAARATRDSKGRFGMWWTVGLLPNMTTAQVESNRPTFWGPKQNDKIKRDVNSETTDSEMTDYRTYGVPDTPRWRGFDLASNGTIPTSQPHHDPPKSNDPNDRGKGRTVETQGGGLAIMRAAWEFSGF
ncbi:hypothetical protein MCOR27_009439 [Pyricularia oryzae]|uniref:Glycosyl hydrolase n=2 Tax=Pyricularia TaxID=48558 RepID=A0ABQ8NHY5_PYRGI|nr:hypothetical protein MCOR01_005134 [Pyricularia oryzae]KAI6297413.1 hypothetical protein MCOR33_006247 [Pyricularia grisea]KAH9431900.1 hypothetical protein MCOR02_009166 [Pyricularia oryzae]KAI6255777.1 hypothetical protein MCOR19_007739 [Pyricularia oryzae]KAI6265478.1 hypothetical protein MCOR26_010709 [Pyricularia oryzae]